MKARVKATGRIIQVMNVMDVNGNSAWEEISSMSTTPIQYSLEELDFIDLPKEMQSKPTIRCSSDPDYWTRLEHTYAGMAMQGMLNNSYLAGEFRKDTNNGIEDMSKIITKAAAVYAHALVEKMKEERK